MTHGAKSQKEKGGACKAEAKTDQQRTEENSAARIAAAERKVEVRLKPRELKLCAAWQSPAPKFRKPVNAHTAH